MYRADTFQNKLGWIILAMCAGPGGSSAVVQGVVGTHLKFIYRAFTHSQAVLYHCDPCSAL
jgi:hypothetical protein